MKPVRPTRPLPVSFLSMLHLLDHSRQIIRDAFFSSSEAPRCASEWVCLFVLEDALILPLEIAATLQRPDIVIFARAVRHVILIELTVPLEDRVSDAHERKNPLFAITALCQSYG